MIGQLSREEVNRKLLHILAVILPSGIFYTPIHLEIHRSYACLIIFSIFVFSVFVEIFRMRVSVFSKWFSDSFSSMMRAEEKNQLTCLYRICGLNLIIQAPHNLNKKLLYINYCLWAWGPGPYCKYYKTSSITRCGAEKYWYIPRKCQ